jgi:hypothetical protein
LFSKIYIRSRKQRKKDGGEKKGAERVEWREEGKGREEKSQCFVH